MAIAVEEAVIPFLNKVKDEEREAGAQLSVVEPMVDESLRLADELMLKIEGRTSERRGV